MKNAANKAAPAQESICRWILAALVRRLKEKYLLATDMQARRQGLGGHCPWRYVGRNVTSHEKKPEFNKRTK